MCLSVVLYMVYLAIKYYRNMCKSETDDNYSEVESTTTLDEDIEFARIQNPEQNFQEGK